MAIAHGPYPRDDDDRYFGHHLPRIRNEAEAQRMLESQRRAHEKHIDEMRRMMTGEIRPKNVTESIKPTPDPVLLLL